MPKKNQESQTISFAKQLTSEYESDYQAIKPTHDEFREKENILLGVPQDSITVNQTTSKVQDPTLVSSIIKQNNSVMAQMPSGKITALSVKNRGKSLFMDLAFHKHVLPNANSQHDAFTKLWMLSFYRKIYGSFGVLVDYVIKPGYVGPDFTLIPARSIIPQSGRISVDDCDRVYIVSDVTESWLKSRDKKVWKNIDKILEKPHGIDDSDKKTAVEEKYNRLPPKGKYQLITRYERDRWVTFSADAQVETRDIENPQKNGEIPVVMCHAYPLLDRFFGLGDFERGKTLHYAASSLINLYLDGVKMSIFPPIKLDPTAISDWSSFSMGPGSVWLMNGQKMNGVEQFQVSPQGMATFQNTYGFMKAAILTIANSTDTSTGSSTDPGFGKTPQALKMQAFSEGMKTAFDRRMLELSTEKVFDKMIDIMAKRQEQPMKLYLGEEDLAKVADVAPDVVQMFESGDMGEVTIKPTHINNCDYRYEIDAGSTVKKDEMLENQTLTELISLLTKIPGAIQQVVNGGKIIIGNSQIEFDELVKRWIITSGIQDWDKIVTDVEIPQAANFEQPQLQNAFQSMQGPQQPPQMQGMPQQQPMPQQGQGSSYEQAISQLQQLAGGANGNSNSF